MADIGDVLDARQASQYLRIKEQTIRRLARNSEIPAFKVGGVWRFKKSFLDRWAEDQQMYRRRRKVLVVDDEEVILDALRLVLEIEGVAVVAAKSGKEALELIRSGSQFALIISDQRMPGMDGVEFLEQARLLVPQTPRVLLTGCADKDILIGGINRGGLHRYIGKPWKNEDLRAHVRQAIEEYEQTMENRRLGVLGRWYHTVMACWSANENESAC